MTQLNFYTTYKQEMTEYDTECMQRRNEDLTTSLISCVPRIPSIIHRRGFQVSPCPAICSAFVINVQSKLQPDSIERSKTFLHTILLSLNRSIIPDEDLTTPPAWNGPPTEITTTSDLLYASLLMSLLAAFVAMLGKQRPNQDLRHTSGSMIERYGDRQHKFDGGNGRSGYSSRVFP